MNGQPRGERRTGTCWIGSWVDRSRFGEEKNLFLLLGFEHQIVQPVACTQYTDYARGQTCICLLQNLPCVSRTGIYNVNTLTCPRDELNAVLWRLWRGSRDIVVRILNLMSVLRPDRFIAWENGPSTLQIEGWMDCWVCLNAVEKRKSLVLLGVEPGFPDRPSRLLSQ